MTDIRARGWIFLGSLVLLLLVILAAVRSDGDRTYEVTAGIVDQKEMDTILEFRQVIEMDEDCKMGELYLNGEKLPYCAYERTFYVPITTGKIPKPENFSVVSEEREMNAAFLEFPEDEEAFESAMGDGAGFALLLYDSGICAEYQVVFTGMPIIDIQFTDETDGAYTIVRMDLHSGSGDEDRVLSSDAKMRVRGGVSRNYPKLGFKLKLIEEDSRGNRIKRSEGLLGLRKDNTWNLAALYADDTKIRDKVAIDLWAKMSEDGIPFDETFGTRMEYVEVIMNEEYMGLYGLMEPIDEKQLGITDGSVNGLHEYYYKKEGEDIAQESDFLFADEDAYIPEKEEGLEDMQLAGLEIKNGDGHLASEAWEPVRQYMKMIRDESFEENAEELLDLTNVADVWIYIQAIGGVDNRAKNLYYCAKVVDQHYKIYFVPWDMDMTWGNETDESSPTLQSYYTYPADKIMNWSPATQLIEANTGNIRKIIKKRWKELYGGILSVKSLTDQFKKQEAYLLDSGAYSRDAERWEDSPHTDDFSLIEEYARERLEALDEYIRGL